MALEVKKVINEAHEQPIMCVAYNKMRKEIFSGAQDGLIKVWDGESGKLLRTQVGHKGWVSDLLFTVYSKMLFSSSVDGNIVVWNDRGKELQSVEFGGAVFCLAWNHKRKQLVVGGNGVIQIYRVTKLDQYEMTISAGRGYSSASPASEVHESFKVLKLHTQVKSHTDLVRGVCCSDSGKIFSAGYDKCICMYESEKPKNFTKYEKCHEGAICSVAFDTDNNWLITGSYDGTVKIWSQEGRCLDVFHGLSDTVTGLCYVNSTKTYWITGKSRKVVAYDPCSANITAFIKDTSRFDEFSIHKLHQVPQSDLVVGITAHRQLVLWRYNPAAAFRVLNAHRDWVESLVVVHRREDPSAAQVFSAGSDGLILRWIPNSALNTDLYTCQEELPGHEGSVLCVVYSEEMDLLISGSEDLTIRIWNLGGKVDLENENAELNVLLGHEGRITGLVCCSDQVLASASHDKTIRFWDLHTRHEIDVIERAHDTPIHMLEYCDTREELATCASEPVVKIWCAYKHSLKVVLSGHKADVTQVRWCAFRECWVTAADDETLCTWDVEGTLLQTIYYRGESVTAMYVDLKNELLLVAMLDRAIRAFDLEREELVRKYTGHTDLVRQICQVEEKSQYLSCSWDKSIRVWFTPKGKHQPSDKVATDVAASEEVDDSETFTSNYEREHPLVQPRALRAAPTQILKLTKAGAKTSKQEQLAAAEKEHESQNQNQLGRRLNELEEHLHSKHFGEDRRRAGMHSPSNMRSKGRGLVRPGQHRRSAIAFFMEHA
ncbi:hypothetical protein CYMTET_49778 [Cymbomonas tetramitiformis]|uniref:Guanine nucleotide-binding protein subunit beta-like protein n=1 Tax=Cymbomonas tetramitiformis TaxID=36881 RepID=A0AAE0BQV1_9CHLO|nr:hypothetical protein CYMTET_49778 [Cymbomonas tetramitiformis]